MFSIPMKSPNLTSVWEVSGRPVLGLLIVAWGENGGKQGWEGGDGWMVGE